jgi:hypothetical protein
MLSSVATRISPIPNVPMATGTNQFHQRVLNAMGKTQCPCKRIHADRPKQKAEDYHCHGLNNDPLPKKPNNKMPAIKVQTFPEAQISLQNG